MAEPTAYEQYLLELINAARADASVAPLAFNGELNEAGDAHTQWMLATDSFSHTGSGGSSPGDRMADAGYTFSGSWSWGENIAWASTRAPDGWQDEVLLLHNNLMNSSGHRANILSSGFREIGLGFEVGSYEGMQVGMLTEDFARGGSSRFPTGVAFDDRRLSARAARGQLQRHVFGKRNCIDHGCCNRRHGQCQGGPGRSGRVRTAAHSRHERQ